MLSPAPRPSGLAGVAAAAVALGVTQLAAVPFGPAADSRTAVGSTVVDLTPGPVKEWAIQTFGTADKLALSIIVLGVIAVIAALTSTSVCPGPETGSGTSRSSSRRPSSRTSAFTPATAPRTRAGASR